MLHAGAFPHGPRASRVGSALLGGVMAYQSTIGPRYGGQQARSSRVEREALLLELRRERREELDGVAVDVDHGVVQASTDLGRAMVLM